MNDTRVQLHWAAQIAAGVGRTLIPQRADDSNTAFSWSEVHRALVQEPVRGVMAGLCPASLTLVLIEVDDVTPFPLTGRTLDDGFDFFEAKFGGYLNRPAVQLPPHGVAGGAPFTPRPADLERFDRGYSRAAAQLLRLERESGEASPVRCWPHHFDIATLLDLGEGRTIGAGWVPGDLQYDEPYWYVTPSPYPSDRSRLAPLPAGFWHLEGWVGAVLDDASEPDASGFLDAAVAACRGLSGADFPIRG